jgi:hypothetical protein
VAHARFVGRQLQFGVEFRMLFLGMLPVDAFLSVSFRKTVMENRQSNGRGNIDRVPH